MMLIFRNRSRPLAANELKSGVLTPSNSYQSICPEGPFQGQSPYESGEGFRSATGQRSSVSLKELLAKSTTAWKTNWPLESPYDALVPPKCQQGSIFYGFRWPACTRLRLHPPGSARSPTGIARAPRARKKRRFPTRWIHSWVQQRKTTLGFVK